MTLNCFAILGIEPAATLDAAALERNYLELQQRFHPDRHAHRPPAERRATMEAAARINEAYRLLRDPISRSTHLLALRGTDVLSATNLPGAFLARQLDWHEALDAARRAGNLDRLAELADGFVAERARLEDRLMKALDDPRDEADAVAVLRQLMFLRRLIEQAQIAADGAEP